EVPFAAVRSRGRGLDGRPGRAKNPTGVAAPRLGAAHGELVRRLGNDPDRLRHRRGARPLLRPRRLPRRLHVFPPADHAAGHIALAALGMLNVLYSLSAADASLPGRAASACFVLGGVTMPAVCFLTAWRAGFRHLFFVPVLSLGTAV